jgi:cob(I)alamin adenosyltransferase
VCRRAERWTVAIDDEINPQAQIYINRLSDWLFVAARYANHLADVTETTWESSQSSDA